MATAGSTTPSMTYLWNQVLERLHNPGALRLLVVGEAASDDDDGRQHDTKVELTSNIITQHKLQANSFISFTSTTYKYLRLVM